MRCKNLTTFISVSVCRYVYGSVVVTITVGCCRCRGVQHRMDVLRMQQWQTVCVFIVSGYDLIFELPINTPSNQHPIFRRPDVGKPTESKRTPSSRMMWHSATGLLRLCRKLLLNDCCCCCCCCSGCKLSIMNADVNKVRVIVVLDSRGIDVIMLQTIDPTPPIVHSGIYQHVYWYSM